MVPEELPVGNGFEGALKTPCETESVCGYLTMVVAEALQSDLPHVGFKPGRVCLPQVHENQTVEHVGKSSVDVEGEQFASHLQILA